MKHVTIGFEMEDDEAWIFQTRSFGRRATYALESSLHLILQWSIEQLSFGCWEPRFDENDEAVTLVLGKEAANAFDQPVLEKAREYAGKRHFAVSLAGVFAEAREAGASPEDAPMIDNARCRAIDHEPSPETNPEQIDAVHPANVWINTEYYYALRFIHLLRTMREKMFVFSAPPIRRVLPESISRLLAEATRGYLYGLNRSAIALCRTVLEATLQDRIGFEDLRRYRSRFPEKGELECLIDLGQEKHMFTKQAHRHAHEIRKFGNRVMHQGQGSEPNDNETWQTLQKIRFILEEVCT